MSPAPPVALRRDPDQTRQQLLSAAFEEIHKHGFRAASLDAILLKTGVTKGALYHHFENKAELGYAVVDEIIRPFVEENWRPVTGASNVIDTAVALCKRLTRERTDRGLMFGCPFNNLINEMSPVDEGFRERLSAILKNWRAGVIKALKNGQIAGQVRKDVAPADAAAFIISSIEGSVGMGKATQSREFLESSFRGLVDYLEHLRPKHCDE